VYFPTSGVDVNPLVPPLVAFAISFFTSMGGVSGAFLLLPFQMSVLGFTTPSVSATNQLFNVVAIPPGVYRYSHEGRMLWPLAGVIIAGTLPGVFLGAWIRIEYLPDPSKFKFFAGWILLLLGLRLAQDVLSRSAGALSSAKGHQISRSSFTVRRISFHFAGQDHTVSSLPVFLFCCLIGVVGGIYGIGGGAIIAPFLVAVFKIPVYTVAGAALLGTLITSVAGVFFYQVLASSYPESSVAPDWYLGFLFGIGGFAGIYLGSRLQKFVPARIIKAILCLTVLIVAARYLGQFFYE
jgi:uncharacterized membrane protein YfcA